MLTRGYVVVNRLEAPVKVAMPFTLKKQLVDDWEMITRSATSAISILSS